MTASCAGLAARLFEYPTCQYLGHLAELEGACSAASLTAAEQLRLLSNEFAALTVDELRELYTRTFDLNPACAPYLSVHLFGENSFKRAQLMTGLAELYAAKGLHGQRELPDHLGVVLAALDHLDGPERIDLLKYCMRVSLEKMKAELTRQENPYALAIEALERLVVDWISMAEVPHD